MMELKTERLIISPMSDGELEELICQTQQLAPELSAAYGEMLAGCRGHKQQRLWYTCWSICLGESREEIGFAGFKGFNGGSPEIGYGIDESFAGRGYTSEAVQALCAWALAQPGVAAVEAEAEESNAASLRVLEKCGFTGTGEQGAEGPRFILKK